MAEKIIKFLKQKKSEKNYHQYQALHWKIFQNDAVNYLKFLLRAIQL